MRGIAKIRNLCLVFTHLFCIFAASKQLKYGKEYREIERTDEYSIFIVRLRPTFDFRQEILSQGSDIEVLEPKWFRDEVAEISKHMWNKYKDDK